MHAWLLICAIIQTIIAKWKMLETRQLKTSLKGYDLISLLETSIKRFWSTPTMLNLVSNVSSVSAWERIKTSVYLSQHFNGQMLTIAVLKIHWGALKRNSLYTDCTPILIFQGTVPIESNRVPNLLKLTPFPIEYITLSISLSSIEAAGFRGLKIWFT